VTHIKNKKNDVTNQKPSPRSTKTNTRLARTKCARKEKIVNGFFSSLYQILTLNVSDKSSCVNQYQRHGKKQTYHSCRTNQNLACIFCIELIVKLLKRNHQTPPPDMSTPTQQPACLPT
jgi:hypothetical protein